MQKAPLATEDPTVVKLVRQSCEGCCGDDKWRGYLCDYHDGYYDGLDEMRRVLNAE